MYNVHSSKSKAEVERGLRLKRKRKCVMSLIVSVVMCATKQLLVLASIVHASNYILTNRSGASFDMFLRERERERGRVRVRQKVRERAEIT